MHMQAPSLPSSPPHLQCHCSTQTPQPSPVLIMDQRHNHLESVSVCHRLFSFSKTLESQVIELMILFRPLGHGLATCHRFFKFIMQAVAAPAVKHVILRQPADRKPPGQVPSSEASAPTLTSTSFPMNVLNKGYRELPLSRDTALEPACRPPPTKEKGLKKSVSINDRVEEIPKARKSKKKKATSRSWLRKGEEPKPLKSILNVGSNLTGKSVSFTIRPNYAKMDGAQG